MSRLAHLTFPKEVEVDLLDDVLLLFRMSESNRVGILGERVMAEPDKKGSPAVVDVGALGLGAPLFDHAGRPVGIVTASSRNPLTRGTVVRSGEVIEAALKKAQKK